MPEIWELILGRKQHKTGKDGGDFLRMPRPDKSCSAPDDDPHSYLSFFAGSKVIG
jgi:hypothetical protein